MTVNRQAHLLVIDPSLYVAETQGAAEVLLGWQGTSRVLRPAMEPGDMLDANSTYEGVDGVVVMGSAASVHDDVGWLRGLKAWLEPLLSGKVQRPLLGICFGHQLIGQLGGGQVGFLREDQSKRVGVEESAVSEASRLLPGGATLRVIVSHREHVSAPPPAADYVVSATRPGVAVDGLEHRRLPIFGVQFHPEARDNFAARAKIEADLVDARLRADGQRLLGAFRALCAGV